jgi:hypothetical protein
MFREAVALQDHPSAQRHQMCIDTSSRDGRADWGSIRSIATGLHGLENDINTQWRMSQESGESHI